MSLWHRRRIYAEAKAKVVGSVWGAHIIQFLVELAILPRSIWTNRMKSTVFTKSTELCCLARNWENSAPPNRRNYLCLCFCINPSSMVCVHTLVYKNFYFVVIAATLSTTTPPTSPHPSTTWWQTAWPAGSFPTWWDDGSSSNGAGSSCSGSKTEPARPVTDPTEPVLYLVQRSRLLL